MHGLLFSSDFLAEGIRHTPGWMQAEPAFVRFRETIADIFRELHADTTLNEAQTEDEVILKVMAALGWSDSLRQATANVSGRLDVPDLLFFALPRDGDNLPA